MCACTYASCACVRLQPLVRHACAAAARSAWPGVRRGGLRSGTGPAGRGACGPPRVHVPGGEQRIGTAAARRALRRRLPPAADPMAPTPLTPPGLGDRRDQHPWARSRLDTPGTGRPAGAAAPTPTNRARTPAGPRNDLTTSHAAEPTGGRTDPGRPGRSPRARSRPRRPARHPSPPERRPRPTTVLRIAATGPAYDVHDRRRLDSGPAGLPRAAPYCAVAVRSPLRGRANVSSSARVRPVRRATSASSSAPQSRPRSR